MATMQPDEEIGSERDRLTPENEGVAETEHAAGKLEAELAETRDRYLRSLAELDNLRRRSQRERAEAVRYAAADLVRDLLPNVDNLRRAIESFPQEEQADGPARRLLEGIEAVEQGFLETLGKRGIRRIDPLGERFDPTQHQAVMQVTDHERSAGTIAAVLQPGYIYADRLLRPAMVSVVKAETPTAS
jgi:molecular chaperone GrpE